jgi:hypothetical protein
MELAGAPAEWRALHDLGEHILGGLSEHHLREATTPLASRMAGMSTCGWRAWIWKEGHVIGTCRCLNFHVSPLGESCTGICAYNRDLQWYVWTAWRNIPLIRLGNKLLKI